MNDRETLSAFGTHMVNGCLIVPVSDDIDDVYALKLQQHILKNVKKTGTKKVIIDVSPIRVLDTVSFSILIDTAQMISMLGAGVVFVGFQAGVASSLVDLDVEFGNIKTVVTMEDGLELLRINTSAFTQDDNFEETTLTNSRANPDESE